MGEGYIQKFIQSVQLRLFFWFTLLLILIVGLQWYLHAQIGLSSLASTLFSLLIGIFLNTVAAAILTKVITKPTIFLAHAIGHIAPAPSEHLVPAPNINDLTFGKELAESLTRHIYDYALVTQQAHSQPSANTVPASLFDQLPVSILGIDDNDVVVLTNNRAKAITQSEQSIGNKLHDLLRFEIDDDISIKDWLTEVREKSLTDFRLWQKVEIKTVNNVSVGYFDMAVSFNSKSASGVEMMIAFYDHSAAYIDENASVSFVALAVHEMRTPVTIMRGYIEAFEDELQAAMTPQLADDLHKMNASVEGLSSFISNILNVARINQGKLQLILGEEDWNTVLPQIVDTLRNRAKAYGKSIELRMEPGLPSVAVDRMTIGEVVTNLVDNAIKYDPDSSTINITSRPNREGLVETTVQDHGVGIPETIMPHLFNKFYRNHRNQTKIGGTGLGLFLSKSIVNAHGGNIWANSKENEGSVFGFTLVPYSELATELQSNNNEGIVRSPHGWIKNHSMQRR